MTPYWREYFRWCAVTVVCGSIACGSIACGFPVTARDPRAAPLAGDQRARAVRVVVACSTPEGIGLRRGSGVVVGPGSVLTARHVVECPGGFPATVQVALLDGREFVTTLKLPPGDRDVAKLTVHGTPFDRAVPRFGHVELDSEVCAATAVPSRARPCGRVQSVDPGTLEVIADLVGDFGNSGSGVWDTRGRLVGILVKIMQCSYGQVCGSVVETRVADLVH